MRRLRWAWRLWRARHYVYLALETARRDPSPLNREALAIARQYRDRLEVNRP